MPDADRLDEAAFRDFVDEYRARCLWSLRSDYYPATPEERGRVLRLIERHGDLAAFRRAARFREWLRRRSSESSSVA